MTKGSIPDPKAAEEFFRGKVSFTTGPVDVKKMLSEGEDVVLVDVREGEDYAKGHIPGAVSLPYEQWAHPTGLSKNAKNIFYCYSQTCHLAARAAYKFAALGYPAMEMEGGLQDWKDHDFPQETSGRKPVTGQEERVMRH